MSWACEMTGLSISRWPTDGRPRLNPGEESVRCNKVKTSRSVLIKAVYMLKKFGKNKDTGHPVSQSDCSHGHWQNYSYYLWCLTSTVSGCNPG